MLLDVAWLLLCVAHCWMRDFLPIAGSCAAEVRLSCGIGSPACSAPRSDASHSQLCPSEAPPTSPYLPIPPQNRDPAPPVLRRHSSSDIAKQKFGTMPLVPIRGDESNSSMLSANQTLVSQWCLIPSPPPPSNQSTGQCDQSSLLIV